MKYIIMIALYLVAFAYHLADIIVRSICNFFIFIWDFKLNGKKFYSYKNIYDFGDRSFFDGKQVSIRELYSTVKVLIEQ